MEAAIIDNVRLRKELNDLKSAVAAHPTLSKTYFIQECVGLMRTSTLFGKVSETALVELASLAKRVALRPGEEFLTHGQAHKHAYFVAEGHILRRRVVDGEKVEMDYGSSNKTIGIYAFLTSQPASSDAVALDDVVAYRLDSDDVLKYLRTHPDVAISVVHALSVRIQSLDKPSIPLLSSRPHKHAPIYVVTMAAAVESFYRSAMAAMLNMRISGATSYAGVNFFPNMHIQVPTRICYINGFKQLRYVIDENVDITRYTNNQNRFVAQSVMAIAPGVCMAPISSLLEANNAGHANPEPILRRATRGFGLRTIREIVFGIGINQLSDFMEENVPSLIENKGVRTAAAALAAGVTSGYLSHVPHNLSAMKMMQPAMSYREHFVTFASRYEAKMGSVIIPDPRVRMAAATLLCVIFPTGVMIRVAQIVGTFFIINGGVALHRGLTK